MRRLLAPVAALVLVALVVALAVLLLAPRGTRVTGLRPVGDDPFGDGDEIEVEATDAVLSDGGRLALVTADGLALAADGGTREVTEHGSRVVDAAWFPNGSTLLVAEGPVPTGGLAVVDADGTVRGTVPMRPSIGFGSGHGMAVAPGGRQAVVTAVERPPLAGEEQHLEVVDLETGATRPLTPPGATPQESGPFFLDERTVAFTETTAEGVRRPRLVDVDSGMVSDVSGDVTGSVVGVAGRSLLVVAGRVLRLVPGTGAGGARDLGRVPEGTAVTAVDAAAGEAFVLDRRGRVRRVRVAAVATTS